MNKLQYIQNQIETQSSWIDELIRWENTHSDYQSFQEDFNSQRQQDLMDDSNCSL
jgi:hypothetical protein